MPNARIAPTNLWDDMTVASNYALSTLPLTNTQDVVRGHVWSPSTTLDDAGSFTMLGTAPGIQVRANCLFIFRHNLVGQTIRVQLWDTPGEIGGGAPSDSVHDFGSDTIDPVGAAGTYDWGDVGPSDPLRLDPLRGESPYVLWFGQSYTFRQIQIDISGSDVMTPEIGRIFLGNSLEVGVNPDYGLQLGVGVTDRQDRTEGGSLLSKRGEYWRTISGDLNRMDAPDAAVWLDIMRRNGLHRDFVVSVFPEDASRDERDYTVNAKFTSLKALGVQVSWRTMPLEIAEC